MEGFVLVDLFCLSIKPKTYCFQSDRKPISFQRKKKREREREKEREKERERSRGKNQVAKHRPGGAEGEGMSGWIASLSPSVPPRVVGIRPDGKRREDQVSGVTSGAAGIGCWGEKTQQILPRNDRGL